MSFEKFKTLVSKPVILPIDNIDTDQIIPARFLKSTTRDGIGDNLFYDWRFNNNGSLKHSKILIEGDREYKIIAAGENFGCGSSREHAAWALYDWGFRAVIASSFADIFTANALNNGLLPVKISKEFLKKIFDSPERLLIIDLNKEKISFFDTKEGEHFFINPYKKNCLLKGIEDIDYLLSHSEKIENYEKKNCIAAG